MCNRQGDNQRDAACRVHNHSFHLLFFADKKSIGSIYRLQYNIQGLMGYNRMSRFPLADGYSNPLSLHRTARAIHELTTCKCNRLNNNIVLIPGSISLLSSHYTGNSLIYCFLARNWFDFLSDTYAWLCFFTVTKRKKKKAGSRQNIPDKRNERKYMCSHSEHTHCQPL